MKHLLPLIFTFALGICEAQEIPVSRPNIVFVLADDLGWPELGCYGNTFNETPHLDELAGQGMRFTQAYAAAPVCSPFRAALMTGQWPARVGITDYLRPDDPKHLSTDHVTIAEMLKASGYATGMMGKWHLTGYANHGAEEVPPTAHGFDEAIVTENRGIGGGSYFHPYHFNKEIEKRLDPEEYLTDRLNLEAVEFIERHAAHPFFLYKSHYAVHTRLAGRPDLVEKYARKPGAGLENDSSRNNVHLAAQLEAIDEGVGMIMRKLEEAGIAGNTILIFMSDNGGQAGAAGSRPVTTNAPLRAGKSTLYEGGIREPLIVRWPGRVPKGTVCDVPVTNLDFYPTFAGLLRRPLEPGRILDGHSILRLLEDPDADFPERPLYWHYPLSQPHFLGGVSGGAIRVGDWKLKEEFTSERLELYNLREDIGETEDMSAAQPGIAASLHRKLKAWRAELGVGIVKHEAEAQAGRKKP